MKLYFSPGACSLASHIAAHEAGIAVTLERVDTKTKQTASGRDFSQINPKGYVPALELDNGEVLTEGTAILQYLADLKPGSGIAPAAGSLERVRVQEWLGYINSELHKSYSPLFNDATPESVREDRKAYLQKRYAYVEQRLGQHDFLFGDRFTIADAYLFVVTNWARLVGLDLGGFPAVLAFQKRIAARPGVKAAMAAEGLIKSAD